MCFFFESKPMRLRTNDLVEYFEKLYQAGGEFQHPDYRDADLWTWKHEPTGIKVWKDAIDLTKGHGGEVYFHYTSKLAFRNITHPAKEAVEIWASLRTSGPNANAWWGKGIYTVPFPPDQWKDREQLLDNNFRNMMKRDSNDPERGPKYVEREPFLQNACCMFVVENCQSHILSIFISFCTVYIVYFLGQRACQTREEYPKRAAFCVPIIINANNAFDVSKRPTPEMEQEGKKPGTNLADKLLNEPNMPTRWCVVLRVSGDGVAWMQKKIRGIQESSATLVIGQSWGKQLSGELEPRVSLQSFVQKFWSQKLFSRDALVRFQRCRMHVGDWKRCCAKELARPMA